MPERDWDDWESDFDEFTDVDPPDEEDVYVTCPNCSMEVYDDAPECPYCHELLTGRSTNYLDDKPNWYVLLALFGMAAVIVVFIFMI